MRSPSFADTANFLVAFDFTNDAFHPVTVLSLRVLALFLAVIIFLRSDTLGRGATGVFILLLATFSVYAYLEGTNSHARLMQDVRNGRLSYCEGIFEITERRDFSTVFTICGRSFVSLEHGETRAFQFQHEWAVENLERECVRAVYNDRLEIVWLGVRQVGPCAAVDEREIRDL